MSEDDGVISGGFILLARKLENSPLWLSLKATHRLVMMQLLIKAQWQDGEITRNGETLFLKRGQVATSLQQLVDDIRESTTTVKVVRTAIDKMEADGFLVKDEAAQKSRRGLLLTLCNYDFYQNSDNYKGKAKGKAMGKAMGIAEGKANPEERAKQRAKQENAESLDITDSIADMDQEEGKAKGKANEGTEGKALGIAEGKALGIEKGNTKERTKEGIKELKDLNNLSLHAQAEIDLANQQAAAGTVMPEKYLLTGKLNVLSALRHYGITIDGGVVILNEIESYQGMMTDELILRSVELSYGKSATYCNGILRRWNAKKYRKLKDLPDEGGNADGANRGSAGRNALAMERESGFAAARAATKYGRQRRPQYDDDEDEA